MSVQISEVEVVPRQQREGQAAPLEPPKPQAPAPELAHEIQRTVSLLHERDLRLHAD